MGIRLTAREKDWEKAQISGSRGNVIADTQTKIHTGLW
jgi:hypothetical protein